MLTTLKSIDGLMKTRKAFAAFICLVLLGGIGLVDYFIGYRISLIVLYVLPIGFATVYVGRVFAVALAISSVIIWMGGDLLAGAPYSGAAIQLWNGGIVLSLFLIVIFLLRALRQALDGLEAKVKDRTEALLWEMNERKRLEFEILNLSERERQQFGHELHDVVCQDLASIAIATHMLDKRLENQDLKEAENAREIAAMVDRALTKARSVARGFFTAGFDVMGLAESLREMARNVAERSGVRCEVQWQENLVILNEDVVLHFFRIAQEAIQNAVKHGNPSRIDVMLGRIDGNIQLCIEDNGQGLPADNAPTKGLGLRIMAYRAGIIGGTLTVERRTYVGTRVICNIPMEKVSERSALPH